MGRKDRRESPDLRAPLDHQVRWAQSAVREQWEQRVRPVVRASQDRQDRKVSRERPVFQAPQAQSARRALRAQKASRGRRGPAYWSMVTAMSVADRARR